ncbi:hypothetical protein CYY_003830 [Polysphondylium violaceum]|uniref:DUF1206 domain-containing protein n=1 Tax=Polysphondylium violaceum TaxID=133409 RepID=A0A8J4PW78_9MYCE|nr:hypothetical protein CYY_003830 [Polysphondylium violaceum]
MDPLQTPKTEGVIVSPGIARSGDSDIDNNNNSNNNNSEIKTSSSTLLEKDSYGESSLKSSDDNLLEDVQVVEGDTEPSSSLSSSKSRVDTNNTSPHSLSRSSPPITAPRAGVETNYDSACNITDNQDTGPTIPKTTTTTTTPPSLSSSSNINICIDIPLDDSSDIKKYNNSDIVSPTSPTTIQIDPVSPLSISLDDSNTDKKFNNKIYNQINKAQERPKNNNEFDNDNDDPKTTTTNTTNSSNNNHESHIAFNDSLSVPITPSMTYKSHHHKSSVGSVSEQTSPLPQRHTSHLKEKDKEPVETNMNDEYDVIRLRAQAKESGRWKYFKFLFNTNKYKWDINQNRRFYLSAQIITRFGFMAKTMLYSALGVLSIAAAVDKRRSVAGPDGVFEELQEMFSGGVIILLLLGLWSYGCWGIFFIIFDIDQLGHKSAGAILKRFGRVFSSGFYFVLGVDAARVLAHEKKKESGTSHILHLLYSHVLGKIVVCVLGVTFFVVSIVYLIYFIKPAKFRRELSTERMNKYLYWTALGFARIGAVGRSMFFGAFGGVLIKAVADINQGKEADTSLLGFQGVFQQIANYNSTLLFIIAVLIVFYALWCFWLVFFRRLPAHKDDVYAKSVLGKDLDSRYYFNGILFRIPKDGQNFDDDLVGHDVNNQVDQEINMEEENGGVKEIHSFSSSTHNELNNSNSV